MVLIFINLTEILKILENFIILNILNLIKKNTQLVN